MSETTMDSSTLTKTLGMECLGFTLATWLFGINTAQAYTYFQKYNDRLSLKLTVVVAVILDLANTILTCWGLFLQIVTNYGKPSYLNMPLAVEPIATALSAFIVECFLSQSIYRISGRNKVLTVTIVVLATAQLAFAIAGCVQMILSFTMPIQSMLHLVITIFALGLATLTDVVITACLVIYFLRGRSSLNPTSSVLDKLAGYAVQRGLMITVLQILLTVFLFAMPGTLVFTVFLFNMGKVYTHTFLAILNRRDRLRRTAILHADDVRYMPQLLVSSVSHVVGSAHEVSRHEGSNGTEDGIGIAT